MRTIYVTYYQDYDDVWLDVWLMDAFYSKEAAEQAIEDYPDVSGYYQIEEIPLRG